MRLSAPVRWLQAIVRLGHQRPWSVLLVTTLLALASLVYARFQLQLEPDRSSLVSENEKYQKLSRQFRQEFPFGDDIVVVVEGGTSSERQLFVDHAIQALNREPDLFRDVFARFELPFVRSHALFYFDLPGLRKLVRELERAQPLLKALGAQGGLDLLMDQFTASRPGQSHDMAPMLPFLSEVLELLLESLQTRGRYRYRSPWENVFFQDVPKDAPDELNSAGRTTIYTTLPGGQLHVLMLRPTRPGDPGPCLDRLRIVLSQVALSHPEIVVSITGETVLEFDEMNSSMDDANRGTLLSLLLVTCLYLASFREAIRPLMIVYILVVSLAWTLGYATLAVGHLNLLTVTFGTILVGLGVDFGVNFLFRYQEGRVAGQLPLEAMLSTMELTGVENLTGAAGMAIAFWAIRFMDFQGIAELGDISGAGVMLCFLGMVTMLPPLVFLQERHAPPPVRPLMKPGSRAARVEGWLLRRPLWVLLLATAMTLWSLTRLFEVGFDYNLLNMQAQHLESVRTELRLIRSSQRSVIFGVSTPATQQEALRLTREFQAMPSVSGVESFLALIPQDYQEKEPLVGRVQSLVAEVQLPKIPTSLPNARSLRGMGEGFIQLKDSFQSSLPQLLSHADPKVRRDARQFQQALNRLFDSLDSMTPGPILDGLDAFQKDFFSDLQGMLSFLKDQRSRPPIGLADLPQALKERGIGRSGKILLRIYPKHNVWEREPMERFVRDLQKVDPRVIGTPVMVYYHTEAMRVAYAVSGWYALAIICGLLLLHFRSLPQMALALLPKVLGILWMLGLMAHYGVQFNPANFMALPLVMGIGLVFGIHVLQRAHEEGSNAMFTRSTGMAIVLDALTNLAGFGALMTARHQGIASLGFVMTVGTLTNLVTALLVLPAVLQLLKPQQATRYP